jgi:hypothetical protein
MEAAGARRDKWKPGIPTLCVTANEKVPALRTAPLA